MPRWPMSPAACATSVRTPRHWPSASGRGPVGCTGSVRQSASLRTRCSPAWSRSRAPPSAVRTLPDDIDTVTAFLAQKPTAALQGVGPVTARTLSSYGLNSAGRIAAAPLGTLQRILGITAGRHLHDAARGLDPTPVIASAPPRSMSIEHHFTQDELDRNRQRAALLALTDRLGIRLRGESQAACALTLTIRYADRSTTTRTRKLPEHTAHTRSLAALAYDLHDRLALQRARVRTISLRAEHLIAAERASRQLLFEPTDEKARRLEAAADRARDRFGTEAVQPAGAAAIHVA
jgi:DNA polymerase IV